MILPRNVPYCLECWPTNYESLQTYTAINTNYSDLKLIWLEIINISKSICCSIIFLLFVIRSFSQYTNFRKIVCYNNVIPPVKYICFQWFCTIRMSKSSFNSFGCYNNDNLAFSWVSAHELLPEGFFTTTHNTLAMLLWVYSHRSLI